MKVIFLDYDGVLNKDRTPFREKDGQYIMAEDELVYRLNLIVDRTDAELVLSSSWRHQREWRAIMKASGIFKPFLDKTSIDGNELQRGAQIAAWLVNHPEVTKYAILDDFDDDLTKLHGGNFFKTTTAFGLTQEIADAVERHLS